MLEMRTSERGSLARCPQQWYWGQVEGLRPNRPSNPLWFGTGVHEAMAQWYRLGLERGPHPVETFLAWMDGERTMLITNEDEEQEYVDARTLGVDMLTRYIEEYGEDPTWHVIATEKKGSVVMPRPEMRVFNRNRPAVQNWLRYHFTWDGVYRDLDDGQVWLMEHKTAASIRTDHLPLDNQAGSYFGVASRVLVKQGILKPGEEIVGIMYNFMRKALKDDRPQDAQGYYHNQPQKQHYIDALDAHWGKGSANDWTVSQELAALPKKTLAQLKELAEANKLTVLGDISKSQPPAYFLREPVYKTRAERDTQLRRIQEEAVFADAYRRGYLPVTKNTSRDCSWCPFARMCELHESGDMDAVEAFKETMYHVEDPYTVYHPKSTD